MLLQPLVENAIKHGVEPKVGSSEIRVEARRGASAIDIVVSDTGLGMDEGKPGYGLEHVRERLKTFYGGLATLTLEANVPQGVRATVRIPQ